MNEIIMKLVMQFPLVGAVLMVLGGLFVVVELFVAATPTQVDDKKLLQFKNGYVGRVWNFATSFFKKGV